MDPTANLAEQRKLAHNMITGYDGKAMYSDPDDARRLAELVEALDQWISRGGSLPTQWVRAR